MKYKMYPYKYPHGAFLFLGLRTLCFLPLFPSPLMSVVIFSSLLSLQKGQVITVRTLRFSSSKMLLDIYCNGDVKGTAPNSHRVCRLQSHYLNCGVCKRALVLSGGRNANAVKKTENDTDKNWDKDCFVTDGGENNVFNSNSK